MDANGASRILGVIDSRIRRLTGSEASTDTTWGEVCAVSADGKLASAYLHGDTDTASQDFRIPGSLAVSVGDKVKVAWNGRGERWVYDVALASAYKKVAINSGTGEILVGDGTAAPEPLPTGDAIPVERVDVLDALSSPLGEGARFKPGVNFLIDPTDDAYVYLDADYAEIATIFGGVRVTLDAASDSMELAAATVDVTGDLDVSGTALSDAIGISMYKSSTQSIASGGAGSKVTSYTNTWRSALGVTWDAYGGSEVRIDIPGVYLVVVQGSFDGNATGSRAFGIMTGNGSSPTTVAGSYDYGNLAQVSNTGAPRLSSSLVRSFSVNDTIAAVAYQSSGGSLNAYGVVLSVFYLGR